MLGILLDISVVGNTFLRPLCGSFLHFILFLFKYHLFTMFFLTIHSILIAPDIVAQISCLFTLYPGESQQYNYNDGLFDFFLFFWGVGI